MVLADAEEVDAHLVGEHRFLDHVANDLRMAEQRAAAIAGDVAKGLEAEFQRMGHAGVR